MPSDTRPRQSFVGVEADSFPGRYLAFLGLKIGKGRVDGLQLRTCILVDVVIVSEYLLEILFQGAKLASWSVLYQYRSFLVFLWLLTSHRKAAFGGSKLLKIFNI